MSNFAMELISKFLTKIYGLFQTVSKEQRTFDEIVKHLRKQNCKALHNDYCVYYGPNNTRCAVGCLIPKHLYCSTIEKHSSISNVKSAPFFYKISDDDKILTHNKPVAQILRDQNYSVSIAAAMQYVHDVHDIQNWEDKFKIVAKIYGLKYKKPNEQATNL